MRLIALVVIFLFIAWFGVAAQSTTTSPTLKVFVLQGEGAVNSIPNHTAVMPVVEVRDANGQPVEGAEVVFELPASGASGFFGNHQPQIKLRTNLQGQAGASFTPNDMPGRFTIRVTALVGDRTGQTTINQTNSMRAKEEIKAGRKSSHWKIALAAGAAGAAAVGIILATRGGHSSGPRTVTVSAGKPTVGGP